MTAPEIIAFLLALLIMITGLAGTVLPVLPSTPIIWIGALAHRLVLGPRGLATPELLAITGVMLFSLLLDFIASMIGARRLGARRAGIVGSVVGGLVGLFFGLPGILIGPFLGALLFERLAGRTFRDATRAGLGAFIGLLAGAVGKIACGVAMIGIFLFGIARGLF